MNGRARQVGGNALQAHRLTRCGDALIIGDGLIGLSRTGSSGMSANDKFGGLGASRCRPSSRYGGLTARRSAHWPEFEALVRRLFPAARVRWTSEGPAVRMRAQERADRAWRDETRAGLRPSYLAPEARLAFLEVVTDGPGYHLSVWLESPIPAVTVYLAWQGSAAELDRVLASPRCMRRLSPNGATKGLRVPERIVRSK
jgi:hypothetical protein